MMEEKKYPEFRLYVYDHPRYAADVVNLSGSFSVIREHLHDQVIISFPVEGEKFAGNVTMPTDKAKMLLEQLKVVLESA